MELQYEMGPIKIYSDPEKTHMALQCDGCGWQTGLSKPVLKGYMVSECLRHLDDHVNGRLSA